MFPEVHRTLALFSVAFLALHVLTAILDPFVTIGWAATVLPFASGYRTLAIGLGTLAVDLGGAVIITSLVRRRLGFRTWRAVHWLAYLAWPVAFVHSLTAGNDLRDLVGRADRVGMRRGGCHRGPGAHPGKRPAPQAGQPARGQLRPDHPTEGSPPLMRAPDSVQYSSRPASQPPPDRLPRLLPAGFAAGPASLADHLARYGPAPPGGLTGPRRAALIEEVERSGLTGRGGAGFPTARKLAAVAAGHAPGGRGERHRG